MSDARVPSVGDFRELEQGSPDGLSLRSAVRAEEPAHARELVKYLQNGVLLAATTTLIRDVLAPDNPVIGGLHLLTDGHWLCYSDLAHYAEYYHLALDAQFIAHAQANSWTIPQLDDTELLALDAVLFGGDTD
ncbi:hypothetical protein [Streptomyces sp. NBC_00233]|uniref:hypothetical protein n=1 Tax=Streptomyces sp. NBC_00233 TaxID=2975686 RepID=UPI00224F1789|nr:hypothetical protein [Streptomyces sp. NBC_00233]MCX5231432.1 hypothetical protein [Streptomyces sp. NBC_00233]